MVNEATIEAYKTMAKDSECPSMETQIRENLERTCDKFAGNEDKFDRCISYLEDCASQILDGKSGLVVSVPGDIKTVAAQAKALHQCLVSADYIGRMAEKELVLVFVRTKAGEPVATAEIKPDGSLGQFYADEDKDDIKPSEKAHIALDAWLKEYRAKARRSMKKTQKAAA